MQLEEVVVMVVEIERAAFARDPRAPFPNLDAMPPDALGVALELGLGDLEGDVVVGLFGSALPSMIAIHTPPMRKNFSFATEKVLSPLA